MSYKETYKDWKYLFDIGPASDMTGGYVDSADLDMMLKSPTKKTAEYCLFHQINYWFDVGTEDGEMPLQLVDEHPKIREIADKYCKDLI